MKKILEKIAADKRKDVELLKISEPLATLETASVDLPKLDFKAAISSTDRINIIAELKKASPSKGIFRENFNPLQLADQYKKGGAAALSVLTEEHYFLGKHEYMMMAKSKTNLPVLCKDFIIDGYQIHYARKMGADAILLIARLLDKNKLQQFIRIARELDLDCLVEVHDLAELDIALTAGADIVGVNSRNLEDFSVDLNIAESLSEKMPPSVVKVAESGILGHEDIVRLQASGFNCFLIGEALVVSGDPTAKLQEFIGR